MDLNTFYEQGIRGFINGATLAFIQSGNTKEIAFEKAIALTKDTYNFPKARFALAKVIKDLYE
jgi:hypothetical protein